MRIVSFDIGIKNLSYCIEDVKDETKNSSNIDIENYFKTNIEIIHWDLINIAEEKENANKISMFEINKRIVKALDKIRDIFLDSNIILLEQQPMNGFGCNNVKMGRIAIILQTYFIIYGIHNEKSSIEHVTFVSPKNKLKLHPNIEKVNEIKKKYKKAYDQNKKIAIDCCELLINNNEKLIEIFSNKKKKDDYADSLLNGLWYVFNYEKNKK
jgi:hypothetical protein